MLYMSRWCALVLAILPIFAFSGHLLGLVDPAGPQIQVGGDGKTLPGFQLPPGFVIEKIAGPPLVQHPMMAGFDERGRLFIAESAGQNLKAADLLQVFPNKMLVLDAADAKGRFHKGHVFADKMSFPMGAQWYRGSLYAGSPPSMWKLTDTQGRGGADLRQELVTKFGFTGNAADIHGPFLGPDGRLYWCDGRHGHEIPRPDGTVMKGKAARIFRCKPDGSDVEVVCGGGMDNPVEIAFTPEGEPFATVDIFHNQPARNDAIIFAIEGGVFPWHDVYREFPRTGPLLPAVVDLGWVAPSGLTSYASGAFGAEYQGNLFSAQFNRSRIQRHIIERDGATFRAKTEDFLVSNDKNFHPTDVLEDADGSLLVIDTGGWFRIGCPTSKIAQPEIKGAIYRIRKQGTPVVDDPRGLAMSWSKLTAAELTELLDDPRHAVRDRAIDELALRGMDALLALRTVLTKSPSTRTCRNAVWALTRMEHSEARALVRQVLADKHLSVSLAAIHSAGLYRDDKALSQLQNLVVKGEPAVRRQAATALGRLGRAEAVPALVECLRLGGDRFLEHASIHALIRIGQRDSLVPYLKDVSPDIRRAAVIALDQMPGDVLTRDHVTPLLQSDNQALLATVLDIIASRPGWGKETVDLARSWLTQPNLEDIRRDSLRGLLVGLSKDTVIQELVADSLRDAKTTAAARLMLLETMSRAPLAKLPASWTTELGRTLKQGSDAEVQQAVNVLRSRQLADFDPILLTLAQNTSRPADLRLGTFTAAAPRLSQVDEALFAFAVDQLRPDRPALTRLAAASALSQAKLADAQLDRLTDLLPTAGALEMGPLLGAFEKSKDPSVGKRLLEGLAKAPGLSSLSPTALDRACADFPDDIRAGATKLAQKLFLDFAQQKAKLEELTPSLKGGDADRGRLVFFGAKASCSACHTVKNQGSRIGPDLTTIGAVRSGRDLLESVLFPSASFARGFESYVVATHAGKVHTGILARETADAVHLVSADRVEIRIARADIEAFAPGRVSVMPQGLDAQLHRVELRDLLAFLQELR